MGQSVPEEQLVPSDSIVCSCFEGCAWEVLKKEQWTIWQHQRHLFMIRGGSAKKLGRAWMGRSTGT